MSFRDLLGKIGGHKVSSDNALSTARGQATTRAATTFAARLTFEAIERTFDGTIALDGASLDIAPGERCGEVSVTNDGKRLPGKQLP